MTPARLALVAALVAALCAASVPVLDEESYLAIAGQLDPLRPYDWWRPWPPWNGAREADAFVYAHPPLFLWWTWVVTKLSLPFSIAHRLVGIPFAALLGGSVAVLAQHTCRRPALAGLVWLTAPVVVLSLQRGFMPDLMVAALMTAAVAGWVRAQWAVAGLMLGLAVWTKYPAMMVVPALLLDGVVRGTLRRSGTLWLVAVAVFVLGEGWLAASYGRIHLFEVLTRAGEIPRGEVWGRILGVLTRLALIGPMVLVLLPPGRRLVGLPAVFLAGLVFFLADPVTLPEQSGALLVLAVLGGLSLTVSLLALRRGFMTGGSEVLLGSWALCVIGGVAIGHNFAAARYLLPASAPIVLLVVMSLEQRRIGRQALVAGAAVWGLLSVALTLSEHRYAAAADGLAAQVIAAHPVGQFTGEWTFRWRMEQAGWTFYTGDVAPGTVVAALVNGSPGALPEGWRELERRRVPGTGLRVIAVADRIGLYGETLGPLPMGWSDAALEEVVVWQAQ
ncbi:MAG: hypothetical protein P8R54_00600 [Myxococcota bacterium]|nr:hypothetical protein [Myxococcota bacterium]